MLPFFLKGSFLAPNVTIMIAPVWALGIAMHFYSGACVHVNKHESREQLTQSEFSCSVTRCVCAPEPANGFRLVSTNASTVLVTLSDTEQCCTVSLGGSKPVQLQRCNAVSSNAATATFVHDAKAPLRLIEVLRCSEAIQRNRLGAILLNRSHTIPPTIPVQPAERVLPVFAALV
jgi:hypothetical protein